MKISPETSNIVHFDNEALDQYLGALFGYYEWGEGESIGLRGLQEKGVKAPGAPFSEMAFVRGGDPVAVLSHAERWNGRGHGAFLIPGIMRAGSADSRQQRDDDVAAFTCLCLDLDNPDRAEPTLAMLEIALGRAGVVVESSSGKLHAYWLFTEPQTDTRAVAKLRHVLALKCGGDPAFQRIVQVIRLPGSIHGKNGIKSPVTLERCEPDCRHDYETLAEKINELHPLVTAAAEAPKELARLAGGSGTMQLSPATSALPSTEAEWNERLLTRTVREGGIDGVTRHDQMNKLAGHYIHTAREGGLTLDEAKAGYQGAVLANIVGADPDKAEATWAALVRVDEAARGPLVTAAPLFNRAGIQAPAGVKPPAIAPRLPMMIWGAHRWADPDKSPERRWIVGGIGTGMVKVGTSHILAAEGGVGKTFALLELALKIAAPREGDLWMGQPLDQRHVGGTAVIITAEDDQDELHIRLNALDPGGERRRRAGDRLIIIPLLQAGGVFQLADDNGRASPTWQLALDQFAEMPDLQLVAIDTMAATLHGEENAALVLQQYMSALNMVQGVIPIAATMATHHVRKSGGKDAPIQSASDMRNAIRGSNALLGAARMVIGIWQPPDWRDQLERLERPVEPGTLFRLAVVKANNSEALRGERLVVRAPTGALVDHTDAAATIPKFSAEQKAWFLAAVRLAVEEGRAYGITGRNGAAEGRHHELPRGVKAGQNKCRDLVDELKREGRLQEIPKGTHAGLLDVTGGGLVSGGAGDFDQGVSGIPDWSGWKYNTLTGMVLPSDALATA